MVGWIDWAPSQNCRHLNALIDCVMKMGSLIDYGKNPISKRRLLNCFLRPLPASFGGSSTIFSFPFSLLFIQGLAGVLLPSPVSASFIFRVDCLAASFICFFFSGSLTLDLATSFVVFLFSSLIFFTFFLMHWALDNRSASLSSCTSLSKSTAMTSIRRSFSSFLAWSLPARFPFLSSPFPTS